MKERPILFSGEMVRAIIEGRKTQTRRIVNPQPEFGLYPCPYIDEGWAAVDEGGDCTCRNGCRCPYGNPEDRLWVRETHGFNHYKYINGRAPKTRPNDLQDGETCYAATETDSEINNEMRWRPSIHMPRWASRITLEVTGVRVERLQDITEADAKDEGVEPANFYDFTDSEIALLDYPSSDRATPYRNSLSLLWDSINGPGSWDKNPWVWVIEFRVI